ncbi:MAG: FixH family protein [Gammaproteobacteria bacterium]|nr:FixH family protein [Gammaproteobacteria bacterium]
MRPPREDTKPWYKQFWPWFLISLPASVVVASMVTINLAIESSDGLVSDDYYKEGLAIKKDADSATRAKALGLSGALAYDAETGAVDLQLEGDKTAMAPALTLLVVHPTIPDRDQAINLVRLQDGRYAGRLAALQAGNWKLRLAPEDKAWRIEGRMPMPGNGRIMLD